MKLFVESHLPVDPETAWKVFESETFDERLQAQTGMKVEKLSETPQGEGVLIRKMKYTSGNELPGLVAKALGSKHLTYTQTNRMDYTTSRLDWTVELPVLQDRVSVAGSTIIEPHPNGCRRVVDGEITVKMRVVGSQIEKAVVAEFEKSMGRAVDIARQLIAERKNA
jgi:hypothetical protein